MLAAVPSIRFGRIRRRSMNFSMRRMRLTTPRRNARVMKRRDCTRRSRRPKEISHPLSHALAFVEVEKRPVDAAKLALAAWPRPGAMDLPKREVTLNALTRAVFGWHERKRISTDANIPSVAFSPNGARVLTGSWDNTARLWDAETSKEIRAFRGHENIVS